MRTHEQRSLWMKPGCLALIFLLCRAATAAGPTPADVQAGSLLMRMADGYVTATLLDTDVNMQVNGLVARVSVMQEFQNDSDDWIEGIYVFPLPDGAAVDHMRLYVGARLIEGEIREKAQARKEYERAKQDGRKTSLVEQQRANLFTTSVANVAPRETVVVEIEYLEDVRYDDGLFSLRFPMTLTPRYVPGQPLPERVANGWSPDTTGVPDASTITPPMVATAQDHRVSISATINAGMALDLIASRYHPVNVSDAGSRYVVVLSQARVPMDHDFELVWRPVPSAAPRALAFAETDGSSPCYLLMVVPPTAGDASEGPMPREMIFLIDTSGSMHGVSMQQAKQALGRALDSLRSGDRFNVIEFNSRPNALFASSVDASPANVGHAQDFVARLDANGGTEMYPALELALEAPANEAWLRQIVFITDGAVGNEEALFGLIGARLGSARLFTVGIGSAPNSWFMRKAAEAGRGSFTVIGALNEVGEKMGRLFRKLEHPQVTGIRVQWPGGNVVESYPEVVPDLYLGEPVTIRVRAETPFAPGQTVRIAGDSISGSWSRDLPLAVKNDSPGVAALWARARIASLLDLERRGADPDETRNAVVETALAHHLVSKYTSLVAVDKTPARGAGDGLTSEQVAGLMPYGQNGSAIFGFPQTGTGAPGMRRTGTLLLLGALLLLAWPAMRRTVCHAAAH